MAAYKQDTEYMAHVGHLIASTKVQKLSEITHHYHSTRLEHSINVSYSRYK
ncbi:HAD family hydrolase, partial [Streptococcus pyogenes]